MKSKQTQLISGCVHDTWLHFSRWRLSTQAPSGDKWRSRDCGQMFQGHRASRTNTYSPHVIIGQRDWLKCSLCGRTSVDRWTCVTVNEYEREIIHSVGHRAAPWKAIFWVFNVRAPAISFLYNRQSTTYLSLTNEWNEDISCFNHFSWHFNYSLKYPVELYEFQLILYQSIAL